MSFVDFPVYNIASNNVLIVKDNSKEEVDLVIVVRDLDYRDKYITNLSQLITAIKLDEKSNVVILKLKEGESIHLVSLHRMYGFVHCMTFGMSPETLNLNIDYRPYQLVNFEKYQLLQADSLSQLMEDGNLKKTLWLNLKKMYGV